MFMKRWKERISRWKFDRKMQALVIISITFTDRPDRVYGLLRHIA